MPTKASTSDKAIQGPTRDELAAIDKYLAQKPDFDTLARNTAGEPPAPTPELSAYDIQIREAVRALSSARNTEASERSGWTATMPVLPKDETASNLSDAVQGQSKTQQDKGEDKKLASTEHHKANPGPVISQDLGEPASREELKKRAEELNK